MKPQWQFRALIRALGGPTAVREQLLDHGFDAPPLLTIRGWVQRNSCPGPWSLALLMIAQRQGFLPQIEKMLAHDD